MDIQPFTPRLRMYRASQLRKVLDWYKPLAEEYNIPSDIMFGAVSDFVVLSMRVNGSTAKSFDFKLAEMSDDSAALEKKFRAYLDTKCAPLVYEIETAIQTFDAPHDPALAPDAPTDPEA